MEIRVLNTIRGIAALIVVVSHYSNETNLYNKLLGEGAGKIGVMIFFLLSGFLLSIIYLNQSADSTNIKKYFVHRVARVVPLYYFVVVTSFLIYKLIGSGPHYNILNLSSLLTHVLFLEGFSVLWTIPVEIQYYVIFPVIWVVFNCSRLAAVLLMVTIILTIFWLTPKFGFNFLGNHINFNIFISLPFFIIGMIFGAYSDNLNKLPKSSWFGLGVCLIFLIYPNIHQNLFDRSIGLWYSFTTLFAVSLFFITWVYMVPKENILFSNKLGDFLGKISYSLYLLHLPILYIFLNYFDDIYPHHLRFPAYIILVLLISTISFYWIENPSKKIIRNIFNNYGAGS